MHSRGVIHRDIKPDNIMFGDKDDINTLKIIDFGLSTYINDNKRKYQCGTPGYMAPEVVKFDEKNFGFSEKCDVFSIGCILYEL